jgi:hypothetical protein
MARGMHNHKVYAPGHVLGVEPYARDTCARIDCMIDARMTCIVV